MRRNGFTLLELAVVLVVFGGLAALIIPVFNRSPHVARRKHCQSNLKRIALSFQHYQRDYSEKFPPVAVAQSGYWAGSIQSYDKSWQLFQCLVLPKNQPKTTDYFYNARLAKVSVANIGFISQTILVGEGNDDSPTNYALSNLPNSWLDAPNSPIKRHLDGANYAFVDGHVKWLKPEKVSIQAPGRKDFIATFAPK